MYIILFGVLSFKVTSSCDTVSLISIYALKSSASRQKLVSNVGVCCPVQKIHVYHKTTQALLYPLSGKFHFKRWSFCYSFHELALIKKTPRTVFLPLKVMSLKAKMMSLNAKVMSLNAKVMSLNAKVMSLNAKVMSLNAKVMSLNAKVMSLNAKVMSLNAKVMSLNAKVMSLNAKVMSLNVEIMSHNANQQMAVFLKAVFLFC